MAVDSPSANFLPSFPAVPEVELLNNGTSAPERINLSDMDSVQYILYGSGFILALDSCLFPLDTVKTVIMSQREVPLGRPQGLVKIIWNIARTEGIARFWRGLPPSVLGSFPGQAMYYLAYETAQDACSQSSAMDKSPFLRGFASGATAEISAGLFYVPADIVAQRLQVQNLKGFSHNSRLHAGPIDLVRKLLKAEGIGGFYRGYLAYIGAYAPASAVQWGSYEHSKPYFHRLVSSIYGRFSPRNPSSTAQDYIVNSMSGGFAGMCSVCANNPLEILRVRQQLLDKSCPSDRILIQKGYWSLVQSIYQREGIGGFYKGLKLRLLVTIPGTSPQFLWK
ncbi:mitochondrial carrier domain-containing protein [Phlyctochytrium arcticum]|nr:mitochondrial carrier domain-containing protein [Phlyctochytrium arcticum]